MIILTRPAIAAIESAIETNGKSGYGVRVKAEAGGCSGPKYAMNFQEAPGDEDTVIEIRDVRLFVDEASLNILTGAIIDYSNDPERLGFNFTLALPSEEEASSCSKPKMSQSCGCGKA
jgi:iron-sulfur cluster assembly protein